ncbi:hypothetical protein [Kribbella capetownensis]|uniref:hypothetical protein n=1 Tax=Kribbella capetownensis TaxID=1572659 RepID=UPI00192D8CEE|nr:hypothetical protein [Kribbella capetownensis]
MTSSRSSGHDWPDEQVDQLHDLAAGNTPVGVMSVKLGRSEDAIRSKAQSEGSGWRRRPGRRTAT